MAYGHWAALFPGVACYVRGQGAQCFPCSQGQLWGSAVQEQRTLSCRNVCCTSEGLRRRSVGKRIL